MISASAALLFVVPTRWRYPTALAGLVVGTVTALATMSAGWHRAGDSMAAFLLVGVWTAIAAGVVLMVDTGDRDGARFEWPGSARWLAVVCCGACSALGVALGMALNAVAPIRDATFGHVDRVRGRWPAHHRHRHQRFWAAASMCWNSWTRPRSPDARPSPQSMEDSSQG